MSYSIKEISAAVKHWLIKGDLDAAILSDNFTFTSPFWKNADKQSFIDKFGDPTEYIETSLSKITNFSPIIECISDDEKYFTIYLTYHTKNGSSVNEVVVCNVENSLLQKMVSVYDLEQTKQALEL